jgi:hypothetical protein
MEDGRIPKKILTQPERKKGYRTATVKVEGPGYSSRGRKRPSMS